MRKTINIPLHIIAFFILSNVSLAQIKQVEFIKSDGSLIESIAVLSGDNTDQALKIWRQSQWENGFLECSIDSTWIVADTLKAECKIGQEYLWGNIEVVDTLGKIKVRDVWMPKPGKRRMNPRSFIKFHNRILSDYESNGFPFVSTKLEPIYAEDHTLHSKLIIDQGPLITFDSIVINSEAKINHSFLSNYLELKNNDIYNEQLIRRLPSRIKEIPYLKESKPALVSFVKNKAQVYLFLEDQKASFVNGILGIQPNSAGTKTVITGQLELKLLNSLKRGELFHLSWRKMQEETQDFLTELKLPYLFDSPFGFDGGIKIYRRDSSFSSVEGKIGVLYTMRGGNTATIYTQGSQRSKLAETSAFSGSIGNTNNTSYGLELDYSQLDYRFNPMKGFQITANTNVGSKKIRDTVFTDIGFVAPGSSLQYQVEGEIQYFIPTGKRSTILIGVEGGLIENESLFSNEMFRFGGNRNLRGFDEESIIANQYGIGTLEWRYLLGLNSRFFAFANGSWYEREGETETVSDTPIGFGTGLSFETPAGIFSISYALGKEFDNPIVFSSAKIHFGFTSLF